MPCSFQCHPLSCIWCCGKIPQRVVLAIMLHLALQNAYNLRVVLNVAIVEMVQPGNNSNKTEVACPQFPLIEKKIEGGKFPWPRETEALILYAFYIGYFVSHVPGGWLADKYGGRYVLGFCMMFSALLTAVFPFFTRKGGHLVAIGLRALLGLVQGPILPSISSFVSTWIPQSERTLLGGISYSGSNLGTILGSIFTGLIIEKTNSWPMAFYIWTSVSLIYITMHLFFVFSFPSAHPYITEEEKEYLENVLVAKRKKKTPWKAILTNVPYWANVAGQFGHNYIYFTLVTYLPTYMKEILHYEIQENALVSALPFIALWTCSLILSLIGNYIIDKKFLHPHTFVKVFGTGSNMMSALLALGAVYAGCSRVWAISLYIVCMIIKSFYYMTLPCNINELSRNYGGIMYGICNGISALSGVFGNYIIGKITTNRRLKEWQLAFWISFGITVVTSIIFNIWSSTERQEFDYDDDEEIPQQDK